MKAYKVNKEFNRVPMRFPLGDQYVIIHLDCWTELEDVNSALQSFVDAGLLFEKEVQVVESPSVEAPVEEPEVVPEVIEEPVGEPPVQKPARAPRAKRTRRTKKSTSEEK